ncbi:hypothetical protein Pst134EA_009591 [Puccinia striiformis f. sp. tritici]|uniref:hypothetical protein n=1 Tax=Puccinia striiformis f. sp. tritici TaxID=168172 RepID=UPI0020075833|nr:hypothetical protein Pst134EA_009591 [Puccinia striiformis f. sp. tritici]KAH9469068.1 hypothetical protein Pst134EA_009591 [Puccinia striiformis f. sp. tritici]
MIDKGVCMLLHTWEVEPLQWFEPYLELLDIRNAEYELNNLQMKESGKASAYIAQFRTSNLESAGTIPPLLFIFAKDFHLESPTNWRLVDCALLPSNS